jgi:hypothetical protein
MEALLRAEMDRPLGGIQVMSNLANFDSDQTVDIAADNLLAKALRDLEAGNHDRADAYLQKALRLPDSPLRGGSAAQAAAHLMLFSAVVDEVEIADPGDSSWLDRALVVLDECGELAALDLKGSLKAVASDYGLEPEEKRRIRAVIGKEDHDKALALLLETGQASPREVTKQCLEAVLLYQR